METILLRYNAARHSDYIMGFVGAYAREYEGGVVGEVLLEVGFEGVS